MAYQQFSIPAIDQATLSKFRALINEAMEATPPMSIEQFRCAADSILKGDSHG